MNNEKNTHTIKAIAQELGFDFCGIAKAQLLSHDARRLETWLHQGMHGSMQYMENYFDKRIDPTLLVPDAKSVITLLQNYYPAQQQHTASPKISKYAFGQDYHEVIKAKLKTCIEKINSTIGEVHGRGFVDSAPVLERAWARESGLGWVGKNGNLIHKQAGSFFFIATLIVDLELVYENNTVKDYCGTCTKCIDACPTDAILPNKTINGSNCISYYTIELKEALINSNKDFKGWAFGCDVCQDVCPWNRFSKPTTEIKFTPLPEILNFKSKDWEEMSEETFKIVFKNSPIKRAKFAGIKRNINFVKTNGY